MPPDTQMHLDLTADERDVRSGARRHLDATGGPQFLRDRETATHVVDRAWWSTAADLGWLAPLVPEELGGGSVTGTPMRELGIVAHEMGRVCGPGPMVGGNAAVAGLVQAASQGWDAGDLLERVVSGQTVLAWAAGDGGPRWNPLATSLSLSVQGEDVVLSGQCAQVEVDGPADLALVSGTANGEPVQVLVPLDAPGVVLEPLVGFDLARRFARVTFTDVRLAATAVIGEGDAARAQIERQWLVASALLAADTCGAMAAGFDMTMEWVANRYAFGRPLSSYQALKHRISDARTTIETAFAVTVAALDALDAGSDDAAELVHSAQSLVGEYAPLAFSEFVQLHGGIGVTWEHDLHVYLRRVISNAAVYGSAVDHQHRLAGLVLKGA